MDFLTKKKSVSLAVIIGLVIIGSGFVVWASNNVDAVEDVIG
ncbi:hypothetical protein HMF8227_01450 [Saliniradius amylolyticus]|uniref:Uncharacterized protein n=1 Tax=Saliniradius amylolyticus TaxID=2183582 RepID=A0A2S2E2Q3_9ALTE|nr:hypothetical protein [Saliniradius amylolyticus]AWL11925.1 hypothetical protein HMF8227_01450 [Saliniradius amylolyticus]